MKNRKIVLWLARLSPKELDQFREFLQSPLHAHRPKLAEMVDCLDEHVMKKPEAADVESFWDLVYPGKTYNANLLNRLLSELASHLKAFLAFLRYREDGAMQGINWLRELRARDWSDAIPKSIRDVDKFLLEKTAQDERYYFYQLQVAVEKMHYDAKNMGKSPGPIFQRSILELEKFYTLNKIKLTILGNQHDNLHATTHIGKIGDSDVDFKQLISQDDKVLRLYRLFFDMLGDPNNLHIFKKITSELLQITPNYGEQGNFLFEKEDALYIFTFCRNISGDQLRKGKSKWAEPLKEIFQVGLERGVFMETGGLPQRIFVSTTGVLSRSGYTQWVEGIVDRFGHLLQDDEDKVVIQFCRAVNFFYRQDFERCKTLLLNFKSNISQKVDPALVVNARTMLCRVWWLLEDHDAFFHEANSLRAHLKRLKAFSNSVLSGFKQFCAFCLKLERVINGDQAKKMKGLERLLVELDQNQVALKTWFIDQIGIELKKGGPQPPR